MPVAVRIGVDAQYWRDVFPRLLVATGMSLALAPMTTLVLTSVDALHALRRPASIARCPERADLPQSHCSEAFFRDRGQIWSEASLAMLALPPHASLPHGRLFDRASSRADPASGS